MGALPDDLDGPGGRRGRGWRHRLTVCVANLLVFVLIVAAIGWIAGVLANGQHPRIGSRTGAEIVALCAVAGVFGVVVLYVRAIARGRTPGHRIAQSRHPMMPIAVGICLIAIPVGDGLEAGFGTRAAVHARAALPTCDAAGISPTEGGEGVCVAHGTTFSVVDSGRTLQMPGYHVRLLASHVQVETLPPGRYPKRIYPDGQAVFVTYQLAVTNDSSQPLRFDSDRREITIGVPAGPPHADRDQIYPQLNPDTPALRIAPAQFPLTHAIEPHRTAIGWANFAIRTPGATGQGSDLNFLTPGEKLVVGANPPIIGEIRLWKWDNDQGRRALGIPDLPGIENPATGAGQIS